MKKNAGYLYLNPYPHFNPNMINNIKPITETDEITKDVPLKIANLTYHNYALSSDDILKLYNSKFDNSLIKLAANTTRTFQIGNKVNFDMYDTENENELPLKPI
jgi:hypothetical protein